MLVRVGAREARSDLGAIDRSGHRSERMVKYSEIKARKVEDFDNTGIGQKSRQIWRAQASERIWATGRICAAGRNLHHVGRSVARRQLYHAKPVTTRIKPHRLGVDRNRAMAITGKVRQVAAMQADGHGNSVAAGRWRRISYRPPKNGIKSLSQDPSIRLYTIFCWLFTC